MSQQVHLCVRPPLPGPPGECAPSHETAARTTAEDEARAYALSELTVAIAATGDPDRALLLAERVRDPFDRGCLLCAIARVLAGRGDRERALAVAAAAEAVGRSPLEAFPRALLLTEVAGMLAAAGHDRAAELAMAAEAQARAVGGEDRGTGLSMLVEAVVSAGDCDRAALVAGSIVDPYPRAHALTTLVGAAIAAGRPDRARLFADRAEEAARLVEDPLRRSLAWGRLATAVAGGGDASRAADLSRRAGADAAAIDNPHQREFALRIATEGLPIVEDTPAPASPAPPVDSPGSRAMELLDAARRAEPAQARKLIALALVHGWWTWALDVAVRVEPTAVLALADDPLVRS